MKHMGMYDPAVDPVVPGGLTSQQIADLKSAGWKPEITRYDVVDAYMTFSDPKMPGGVTLRRVSVPAGTEYLYNAEEGTAIVIACGNKTCWRHLL
ncbi:hypothetical protein LGM38_17735 [Burkholderia vietnamiensis]|uniref:hypothetical protein n=1 Tax=Burkholderia vietnamiensis TaxID=60552 RepID=UPI001CF39F2E|nr:hypothetical protein [Burkholderia vietnamiensis]MCA8013890.1 hypothetical protein [Burkholderia vietnamiensis]HDR8937055.1 hypothetical protein [Burkholderia vietnamiensis]HDR9260542.1 hypothetical protein [Burkholderia vietnamiensis]